VTITTTPKTSPVSQQHAPAAATSTSKPSSPTTPSGHPPPAKISRASSSQSSGAANAPLRHTRSVEEGSRLPKSPEKAFDAPAEENNNESPSPLPAEYWMTKQPLADQIVITDVTVNLTTVTIRECTHQDGFFKAEEEKAEELRNLEAAQAAATLLEMSSSRKCSK